MRNQKQRYQQKNLNEKKSSSHTQNKGKLIYFRKQIIKQRSMTQLQLYNYSPPTNSKKVLFSQKLFVVHEYSVIHFSEKNPQIYREEDDSRVAPLSNEMKFIKAEYKKYLNGQTQTLNKQKKANNQKTKCSCQIF